MSVHLKPLAQQVLLITGATSVLGKNVLKAALEEGARVFMVAKDEESLQAIQDEMVRNNFHTAYAIADVAEIDQLRTAADHCLRTFGTIDTWINCADENHYARLLDMNETDAKQIFDTNFWGVVNGCKVSTEILRHSGGAIINIGSVLPESGAAIQGMYRAAKHAVKGFTDSLRKELTTDKAPISLSFIAPENEFEESVKIILKAASKPMRDYGTGSLRKRFYPFTQALLASGLALIFFKRKKLA